MKYMHVYNINLSILKDEEYMFTNPLNSLFKNKQKSIPIQPQYNLSYILTIIGLIFNS